MLVLNVTFKCAPGRREEFRELIRAEGIDTASRNEDGNYKYDLYLSTEDPDDILLVEFWKDVPTWQYHRTLPHYAKLGEITQEFVIDKTIQKSFTEEE